MNSTFAFIFAAKTKKMDVVHYFEKVDFTAFYETGPLNWKLSVGSIIEKTTQAISENTIKKLEVAIVGIPFDSRKESNVSNAPEKIREELYKLSKPLRNIKIADFGNLKPATTVKGNFKALRDIVDYFNELNIVTIVIGGSQDLTVGACEAFQHDKLFSLTLIDSHLNLKKGKEPFNSSNFLSRIFSSKIPVFQYNLLAYQTHFIPEELFLKTNGINQNLRLGLIRSNLSHSEPIFRNTDIVSFDLGAIKYTEAPGNGNISPNGLNSDEACQMARYAGISSRIKVFGLFEFDPDTDVNNLTAKLSAQIIWYFLDGFIHRTENHFKNDNFKRYQVEVSRLDKPLVFLKNDLTNQWWMEIETLHHELKYFGCLKNDYEQAAANEIPELWIKFIQKLDETLK